MAKWLRRPSLGARVPHHKGTADSATVDLPVPARVRILMQQHIGAPAKPVVEPGAQVLVGTRIGRADGAFSADVHASVSGTVAGLEEVTMPDGSRQTAVVIDADGRQAWDPALQAPAVTDRKSFVAAIARSGLVGLGGAGFPTAVKLDPKGKIDTLLINAAECEPYITSDSREMRENADNIRRGIEAVRRYLDIPACLVVAERRNQAAAGALMQAVGGAARLRLVKNRYPQGAEKVLIEKATGRVVPRGKLPADVGVLVMNVSTVGSVGSYLADGRPLVTRRVTVAGDAVRRPGNIRVPLGAAVQDVLDFCGLSQPPAKVLAGGPMMGLALENTAFPLLKQNNAILAMTEGAARLPETQPCIRCSRCNAGCPMGLMVTDILGALEHRRVEEIKKLQADLCIECGVCSYVCPAKRPLTQRMRLAKAALREGGKQ